jgi:hypothetical protein
MFFVRVRRWWYGVGLSRPFVYAVPYIAGGSDGLPAQGSYLLMADEPGLAPAGYSEIAEVTNISGGGGTTERIDFTHLRSPNRRREYKPSFIDSGILSFTIQYIPENASHVQLLAYLDSQEEFSLREVFPDGNGWDYFGYIASAEKTGQDVGGKLQLNVTYQITGDIEFEGTGAVLATGADAGTPGSFTPSGAVTPANFAAMTGIVANPATTWTTGQHVVLLDTTTAHWKTTPTPAWYTGIAV